MMKLWQALTEKSWQVESVPADAPALTPARDFASKRIALCLFLAIATVLFSLFVVTFLTHSQYPGFQPLTGDAWRPLGGSNASLWFNTGLLALSSLLMQAAVSLARAARPGLSLTTLAGAGFMALMFLLAQFLVWQQMTGMGYGVRSNPASSYFFLLTGVHGLHLFGGLVVLYRPLHHIWHDSGSQPIINSLRLCALYWHYLLVVWLLLFWLLTRSPETYRTLAILCGVES